MAYPFDSYHPAGELVLPPKSVLPAAVEVETYAGKLQVEWDQTSAVTPNGPVALFYPVFKIRCAIC